MSSLLVPAILFFALGMFACLIKSDLKFPPDMHKMIVIYLLIGIGLHGGRAFINSSIGDALPLRGSSADELADEEFLRACAASPAPGKPSREVRFDSTAHLHQKRHCQICHEFGRARLGHGG